MPAVEVELRISWSEYLQRYRVGAAQVLAFTRDGRRVRFPANILQRFLAADGVHGHFRIHFDDTGKLLGIERCSDVPR